VSESALDTRKLEHRTIRRTVVNTDRRSGLKTYVVEAIGDQRFVWAGTGDVAAAGSVTLYLTTNGESGGDSLFQRAPVIFVGRDLARTSAGIAAASGPLAVGQDWSLGSRHDEVDKDLLYLGQTRCYAVKVTNKMTTTENFVVIAQGVG